MQTLQDKVSENSIVMAQVHNNSPAQAMRGGFSDAVEDAIFDSQDAFAQQTHALLQDPQKLQQFAQVMLHAMLQGHNHAPAL